MPAVSNWQLLVCLLVSGASHACGFAALGVALYASGSQTLAAGLLFAAVGFVTGVVRMAMFSRFDALPAQARLAAGQADGDGPSPLSDMAHATLAAMQQPRAVADVSVRTAFASAPGVAATPADAAQTEALPPNGAADRRDRATVI